MLWYYEWDGKQAGPVSDEALADLLHEETINYYTLVWREGMSGWKPLGTVRPQGSPPPVPGVSPNTCVECGRTFPPDQLINLNKSPVCGECKPVVLQRLAEGVAAAGSTGMWREGGKIVTVSETPFPDRCVKCNAPANGFRLKRVLYWQHPAYYLLIVCYIVVMIIVLMIVRKKAVLHIGLCEVHRRKRNVAIAVSWAGLLVGVMMMCGGGFWSSGWLGLTGVVLFLFSAIWGTIKGRVIVATKITKQNVWVRGAGPDFLDSLPRRPL